MASKPRLCISEINWFFNNNISNLEVETFKNRVNEFFTSEKVICGKKLLLLELETLKGEKFKFPTRGTTKFDRVSDISFMWKYAVEHSIVNDLPVFVIQHYDRVPPNLPEDISREINAKFNNKLELFDRAFEEKKHTLIELQDNIQQLLSRIQTSIVNAPIQLVQPQQHIPVQSTSTNWADIVNSLNVNNVSNVNNQFLNNTVKSNFVKVIGKVKNSVNNFKIKASKIPIKKSVLFVSNVNLCTKNLLEAHLTEMDIKPISVRPVFNKSNQTSAKAESDPSTSFRVCIHEEDIDKILNEDNWPEAVFIRKWIFNSNSINTNRPDGV